MILSIIGIILGLIAIGLFIWLKKEQQMNFDLQNGDLQSHEHGMNAMMENFNNYQIETDRKIDELEKIIKRNQQDNTRQMDRMNKSLPSVVRTVVGHIEFAKPLDKK